MRVLWLRGGQSDLRSPPHHPGGEDRDCAYILQGRWLGLWRLGLPVGGLLVEGDLRRAGPQRRWVTDALGWATGKAGGVVVGVLGVGGVVVGGVLGAGLVSLVEIGSAGEDVLDQSTGGAPGLDGGRGLLLLLLLLLLELLELLLVAVVGLLVVVMLVVVSEGRLRGGVRLSGQVFEGGAEGGVRLDGGGYLVISLRLRSGNSIYKFMHSLAGAGVGHGACGVEGSQLVQLALVMGRRVVWSWRRGGGSRGVEVRC